MRLIDLSIRSSLLGPTFDVTFMQLAVGLSIGLIRPIEIAVSLHCTACCSRKTESVVRHGKDSSKMRPSQDTKQI